MTTKENLFLIMGATGNTGTPTVKLLCDAGHRVRAFVHDVDERSTSLEELGAEVVAGDFLDFDAVSSAMAGVTAAYFCYPVYPGALLQATTVFAQAASEAGVHAVVNMSQISARREATSNAARQHWLAERLLDRTTMVTTHLRPTFFAELINWFWVRRENEGVLRLPFGNGHHAPISARDQANVIAAILQNPDPHDRQIYPLVGPEELDHYAIARKVQQTLGIPVRYDPVTIPTFAAALTALGATPFFVQHLSHVAQDYRDGIFAGTNNLVEVIGGSKPMTVEDYVAAIRDEFNPTAASRCGMRCYPPNTHHTNVIHFNKGELHAYLPRVPGDGTATVRVGGPRATRARSRSCQGQSSKLRCLPQRRTRLLRACVPTPASRLCPATRSSVSSTPSGTASAPGRSEIASAWATSADTTLRVTGVVAVTS